MSNLTDLFDLLLGSGGRESEIVYLGKGDGTDFYVPTVANSGDLAKVYRENRLVYIHTADGRRTMAKLKPGIGLPYKNVPGIALNRLTAIAVWPGSIGSGYRLITDLTDETLALLDGETPDERILNVLASPKIESISTMKVTTTNPPSRRVKVQGPYFYVRPSDGETMLLIEEECDLDDVIKVLTSLQHNIAVVCLNPETGKLVAVPGTAKTASALPQKRGWNEYHVLDVDTYPYEPLSVVYIFNGQINVEEAHFYRGYSVRRFVPPTQRLLEVASTAQSCGVYGDIIAMDTSHVEIYSESGYTDNLQTIAGGNKSYISIIQAAQGHTITVKHNVDNIWLAAETDYTLTGNKRLLLHYDGATAYEVGGSGGAGATTQEALFYRNGALSVSNSPMRIYNKMGATKSISEVYLYAETAPTGAAIIVDIHKSGTTIFTTQSNRPQIAAGANTGNSTTVENAAWAVDEYLELQIDQIGSTIAGSNLTVTVVYS